MPSCLSAQGRNGRMPSPRDRERRLIDATLAARVAFGGVDCPPAPARRGADLFATVAVILLRAWPPSASTCCPEPETRAARRKAMCSPQFRVYPGSERWNTDADPSKDFDALMARSGSLLALTVAACSAPRIGAGRQDQEPDGGFRRPRQDHRPHHLLRGRHQRDRAVRLAPVDAARVLLPAVL